MEKPIEYTTLHDVDMRKEQLLHEIRKDSKQMDKLTRQLFAPAEPLRNKRGGLRLQGMMNMGANVFDGLLLAWKLYRKLR
ncbi:MAG: hypothetical protein IJV19_03475 [Prevotella sp.]|nr:hypothetical protein [Prevotella sp.]